MTDSAARNEPREMTARDWKALYLVHRLAEQVVLHGAIALDNFASAIGEVHK